MKITRDYPDELVLTLAARAHDLLHQLIPDNPNVAVRVIRTTTGHRTELVLTHDWAEGELETAIDAELADRARYER